MIYSQIKLDVLGQGEARYIMTQWARVITHGYNMWWIIKGNQVDTDQMPPDITASIRRLSLHIYCVKLIIMKGK